MKRESFELIIVNWQLWNAESESGNIEKILPQRRGVTRDYAEKEAFSALSLLLMFSAVVPYAQYLNTNCENMGKNPVKKTVKKRGKLPEKKRRVTRKKFFQIFFQKLPDSSIEISKKIFYLDFPFQFPFKNSNALSLLTSYSVPLEFYHSPFVIQICFWKQIKLYPFPPD